MRGNHLFSIFNPERFKKGDSPTPGFRGPGEDAGEHIFGIFSLEKLKKVIPPHRGSGFQAGAQMRGNHLFGICSPEKGGITFEKLKKVIPPHRGSGVQGKSPDAGESPFRRFQKLKKSDSGLQGSRRSPDWGGNHLFGIFSPGPLEPRAGITFLSVSGLKLLKR